jgi:hypothetical protein
VEDFVSRHADQFLDAIESEVRVNRGFAEAVAHVDLSDVALNPAIERFLALQSKVRGDLGISYWEGWLPLPAETSRQSRKRRSQQP